MQWHEALLRQPLEGNNYNWKIISEQKDISLRNWGHVLTPFVGTCHSVGKAADEGRWVEEKKRAHWAFRAGGGVAADEALERAGGHVIF